MKRANMISATLTEDFKIAGISLSDDEGDIAVIYLDQEELITLRKQIEMTILELRGKNEH